jgi:hypothetical protein
MGVLTRRLASMGLEAQLPCARDLLGKPFKVEELYTVNSVQLGRIPDDQLKAGTCR